MNGDQDPGADPPEEWITALALQRTRETVKPMYLAVYGDVMGPVILEAEMWLLEAKARAETATALCQTNKRSKEQHA